MKPSRTLQSLTTSVFSQMSLKKKEKLKQGQDMVDLSIGSPDLPPPTFVKDCLSEEVQKDGEYGYPLTGTDEFKEAVSAFYGRRYHVDVSEREVLQLMGSQEGLSHLAFAYLDPEDVVIVPDPGYPIYAASVQIAGAEVYTVPLLEENDFLPKLEDIPEEICQRAKMIVLNYPGNPIPALPTATFFESLIDFARKHDILIVHDFAYSELIFDQVEPLSILSIPGAEDVAIEFNSLSKSFNMAGCRIGYLVGHTSLIEPLAVLKSHIDYGVFYPIQKAATLALTKGDTFLEEHRHTYQTRRDMFMDALKQAGWHVQKPQGGMFVWGRIPAGWTSLDFALEALEYGVVVTPGQAFGAQGEGYVRMALVHDVDRLEEAAQRLKKMLEDHNSVRT
ncbi:LL-diaminopimelate aminotransferase [Caldalkalibacillus salinus]|uniref:LL-diaminopimelate aminotransferase n=1 Tax=Caldalkalibacillus salinus TaxID=2803787 RepID=UPI001924BF8E